MSIFPILVHEGRGVLVDWLTLRYEVKTADDQALVDALSRDRDVCHKIRGGELVTLWWPREKTSDTHRVVIGLSLGAITIEGSPARVIGNSNVFGSGDPAECARAMIRSATESTGVILPPVSRWRATRVDLTQNYDCGPHVAEALDTLRNVCGGHLRVSSRNNGCYWNEGSDLWSAVAYMKGPHLQKQCRSGRASESDENVALAHRLLRLEIRLRNHYIKRADINISRFTEKQAMAVYQLHAKKIIPDTLGLDAKADIAKTLVDTYGPRLGRALLGTWGLIQAIGPEGARERMSVSTWTRHQKFLRGIGIGKADMSARKVVDFRPRLITARPVDSWAELRKAA